ncbi:MAG: hypothetical protein ACP5HD_05290 [Thermoproteus sp.]
MAAAKYGAVCGPDACFASLLIRSDKPLDRDTLASIGRRALVVAVRPDAVKDWRYLLQAMAYAYAYKRPARDWRISALMYLTASDSIGDALAAASPIGSREYVVAVYGEPGEVADELAELPQGEPFYPEGDYDPWLITRYALKRLT